MQTVAGIAIFFWPGIEIITLTHDSLTKNMCVLYCALPAGMNAQ